MASCYVDRFYDLKKWKYDTQNNDLYLKLGLSFATLASLVLGHSKVSLGWDIFLKISPDIFIIFSETSSNYPSTTLIVSIHNKKKCSN